jgi:hypothetical protein
MLKRIFLGALLNVLLFTCAVAQDDTEIVTGVRFTPRLWLSMFNPVDGEGESREQYVIPFFGATLLISPSGTPNTNFFLTGLYGEGEGEYYRPGDAIGESTNQRLDVEFLIRRNIPGKSVSIFFGARYINFEDVSIAGDFQAESISDMIIAEFGVGIVTDLTEDGRHRVFANLMPGIANASWDYEDSEGWEESDSGLHPTLDVNFGFQFGLNDRAALSARYRGFFVSEENDYEQSRLVTIHGPELALSIGF